MRTMYIDVRAYNGKIWSSVKGGCMSWDYLTAVVYILHFRLCAARKHLVVQSWYFNWGENKHSCVTCPINMGIIMGRNQGGNIWMGTISCLLQLCILTCQRYRLQAAHGTQLRSSVFFYINVLFGLTFVFLHRILGSVCHLWSQGVEWVKRGSEGCSSLSPSLLSFLLLLHRGVYLAFFWKATVNLHVYIHVSWNSHFKKGKAVLTTVSFLCFVIWRWHVHRISFFDCAHKLWSLGR